MLAAALTPSVFTREVLALMHRSVRHLLQPSKAFIKSVSPEAQTVRFAPASFFTLLTGLV